MKRWDSNNECCIETCQRNTEQRNHHPPLHPSRTPPYSSSSLAATFLDSLMSLNVSVVKFVNITDLLKGKLGVKKEKRKEGS